jgi:hypothetical protein
VSSPQLGTSLGGRQAPRRESMLRIEFGWTELGATLVAALYAVAAVYLVGSLGMSTSEAMARTVRAASVWNGFETNLAGFGFERPPLLTLLALPLAAFEGLRPHGLASALGTSLTAGFAVIASARVARHAGLGPGARVIFIAAFALNPLLLFAGVFGLPETIYVSLMLIALAEFSAWLDRPTVSPVIVSGLALGVAFLVRYNVVLIALVMAWAYWFVARREGGRASDRETDIAHALAFAVPVVFIVGLWTMIAWFPRGELLGYLRLAEQLTLLGNDDAAVLERMSDLSGNVLGTIVWVGGWAMVAAPLSVIAVVGLAVHASRVRDRGDAVLALLCAAILVPELLALATGRGQAHVPHLFVAIVPAFVVFAHRERRASGGEVPAAHETTARRRQYTSSGALALASLVSAITIVLMPASDPPVDALRTLVLTGTRPSTAPVDATLTAAYIRDHAGPGDVVVDVERHAQVMLLVGDIARFQTDGSAGEEATLYQPSGLAAYVLTRRQLSGQAPGRIERGYPGIFELGAPWFTLAFESGDYRLYAVAPPDVP